MSQLRSIKAVILGDHSVGRTAIKDHCEGDRLYRQNTIGVANYTTIALESDSYAYQVVLWDYGGEVQPYGLRRSFYDGAQAAIVVFDINIQESFDHIHDWIHTLWSSNSIGPVPLLIVGNKNDLRTRSSISAEVVDSVARSLSDTLGNGFQVRFVMSSLYDREALDDAVEQLWRDTDRFVKWRYPKTD